MVEVVETLTDQRVGRIGEWGGGGGGEGRL